MQLSNQQKEGLFLASGDTHPELATAIAQNMGMALGPVELRQHPNGEPYVRYEESVRGKHVMVIQPHAPANGRSVSDSFHQHLEMIYAAKLASADSITAVSPNLAGARQDKKSRGRESVSIAVTLRAMHMVGASRIVTVDLHTPQSLAIFDGPHDHLPTLPLLSAELAARMTGNEDDYVMVAPDEGRSKRAEAYAAKLGIDSIQIPKKKSMGSGDLAKITRQPSVDGVDGRTCFLIDDMIDTAGTIGTAADVLRNSGAENIYVAATHGWFSGPAVELLKASPIKQIIVTDTIPLNGAQHELGSQLKVISVAGMVANALKEIATGGSVSTLYDEDEHYI